jgi:hypothetical protein
MNRLLRLVCALRGHDVADTRAWVDVHGLGRTQFGGRWCMRCGKVDDQLQAKRARVAR